MSSALVVDNDLLDELSNDRKPSKTLGMRNSLRGPREKPPWKPSGRPLATPVMPPGKLGSEKADRDGPSYRVEKAVVSRAHLGKELSRSLRGSPVGHTAHRRFLDFCSLRSRPPGTALGGD